MKKVVLKNHQDVQSTYKFPNGMVSTFNFDNEQIPELQGPCTEALIKQIQKRSSEITDFFGFDEEDFEAIPERVFVCEVDETKFVAQDQDDIGQFITEILNQMEESKPLLKFTIYTANMTPKEIREINRELFK
jgi:hypothetical protein